VIKQVRAAVVSNRHGTRKKRKNGLNARRISRYLLPKRIQVDDQCHTHADGSCSLLTLPSTTRADECPLTPNLPSSDGSQPANLGVLKPQLLDYKCFGAYDRDVTNVLAEAMAYVDYRAKGSGKLALVLDIDETSLSNLPAQELHQTASMLALSAMQTAFPCP
jgi:hypothetical protein